MCCVGKGKALGLPRHCLTDLCNTVTNVDDEYAACGIDVFLAVGIKQQGPLATYDGGIVLVSLTVKDCIVGHTWFVYRMHGDPRVILKPFLIHCHGE
jgi:hypothetical protein